MFGDAEHQEKFKNQSVNNSTIELHFYIQGLVKLECRVFVLKMGSRHLKQERSEAWLMKLL